MKKKEPEYLITFECLICGIESYGNDTEELKCIDCGEKRKLILLKKEKYCKETVDEKIMIVNDKLMEALKEDLINKDFEDGYDEDSALDRLKRGKKYKEEMKKRTISKKERKIFLAK